MELLFPKANTFTFMNVCVGAFMGERFFFARVPSLHAVVPRAQEMMRFNIPANISASDPETCDWLTLVSSESINSFLKGTVNSKNSGLSVCSRELRVTGEDFITIQQSLSQRLQCSS